MLVKTSIAIEKPLSDKLNHISEALNIPKSKLINDVVKLGLNNYVIRLGGERFEKIILSAD